MLPHAPASVPSKPSRGGQPTTQDLPTASSSMGILAEKTPEKDSGESTAALRRARNRAAAHKSRAKKSKKISSLEEDMYKARDRRAELITCAEELKSEVYMLKTEILRHGQCDYPPIKQYLQSSVTKILPVLPYNGLSMLPPSTTKSTSFSQVPYQ